MGLPYEKELLLQKFDASVKTEVVHYKEDCLARKCCLIRQIFMECTIINPAFSAFYETSCYSSVKRIYQFFSAFHWLISDTPLPHHSIRVLGNALCCVKVRIFVAK